MDKCNYLCNISIDALVAAFSNRLAIFSSASLPKETILTELKAAASELHDPGVQFDTECKRRSYFTQNRSFIVPEEITVLPQIILHV